MMKNLLPVFIMLLLGCSNHTVDQQSEAQKIMNLSREWAKSAGTDNLERTLSYWADDAVCLFPDLPPIKGKEEIRKMLKNVASIPGYEVNWEPTEAFVSLSGDMAYVLAQNYFKSLDSLNNPVTTYNKSLEIWKKQANGEWKCVVDMYNPDPSIKSIK